MNKGTPQYGASFCEHSEYHCGVIKRDMFWNWLFFQFRLSGIPGHVTADTYVTDTCDFFTSLTRLTRPKRLTRPTRLTRSTRLTRITRPPAFILMCCGLTCL